MRIREPINDIQSNTFDETSMQSDSTTIKTLRVGWFGVIFIPNKVKGDISKVLSKLVHKFPNYVVLYQEKEVLDIMLQNKKISSIIILDPNNKELYKDYTKNNNIITIW
jgi:NCAIR mutase (PurE)-related protein